MWLFARKAFTRATPYLKDPYPFILSSQAI